MGAEQPTLTGLRVPGGRKPRPEASRRPPRRRYAYGAERERAACEKLRRLGFTPMRSPASKGPVDVLGVDCTGQLLALQIKATVNPPTPKERADCLAAMHRAYPAARCEVWWWNVEARGWFRYPLTGAQTGQEGDAGIDAGHTGGAPSETRSQAIVGASSRAAEAQPR